MKLWQLVAQIRQVLEGPVNRCQSLLTVGVRSETTESLEDPYQTGISSRVVWFLGSFFHKKQQNDMAVLTKPLRCFTGLTGA